MPELPDVTVYVEALERKLAGLALAGIRVRSPSLLRSVDPPLREANGKRFLGTRRIGKRIAAQSHELRSHEEGRRTFAAGDR